MNLLPHHRHHIPFFLLFLTTHHFSNANFISSDTYTSWKTQHGSQYENSVFLPATTQTDNNGVAIHWTIDKSNQKIQLAAATQSKGWLGFGIAEAGGMPGADVVLFSVNENDNDQGILTDAHVGDGYVSPTEDTCQDWNLLRHVADDGILIFEAERALDTKDPQDRSFVDDSDLNVPAHRVIAAWGDSKSVSYHGQNTARGAIRFYGSGDTDEEVFAQAMESESDGILELTAVDYPIPAIETMYAHICFNYTDVLDLGIENNTSLSMIGFEPLITPETKPYVHHFVLSAFNRETLTEDCGEMFGGEMIYAWAPGEGPFLLPSDVGLAMGTDGYKSFSLQIHYNNPALIKGLIDSSGVRIHYSNTPRKYAAGFMQIGDSALYLEGQPVGGGLTEHEFTCPSSCTQTYFNEEVTVFREMLHMHKLGKRMVNEQLSDDGTTVKRQAVSEYYDYKQNGLFAVQQEPFLVQPGDGFRTTCNYYDEGQNTFGLGSQDEMCIVFMMYYPKQNVPFGLCGVFNETWTFMGDHCRAEYDFREIEERDLERKFGTEVDEDVCPSESTILEKKGSDGSTLEKRDSAGSAGSRYWDGMGVIGMVISFMVTITFGMMV